MKDDPVIHELPVCEVLASFEKEDRAELSAYGKFYTFRANETVIREGDAQNCLYLLINGMLHAVHKVEDGATPIGTIKAGEWFGEVNIFDPQKASAAVISRDESHVWRISRQRLEEYLNNHPSFGCLLLLGVSEVLARRTRELVNKLNATWELSW